MIVYGIYGVKPIVVTAQGLAIDGRGSGWPALRKELDGAWDGIQSERGGDRATLAWLYQQSKVHVAKVEDGPVSVPIGSV